MPAPIRQSLRLLLRHKRFAALAVLSLGVAIALNTTMYSVLDALIHPHIAMHEPERLYTLAYMGDYRGRVPEQEKLESIRALRSLEGFGGGVRNFYGADNNLVERGTSVYEARVRTITDTYFALTGVQPLHGRLLSAADATAEPRPIVVGERLWQQLFPERAGFDTATVILGGEPRPVVGILDHASDFPGRFTDIWQLPRPSQPLYARYTWDLVRLRPGVTRAEAEVELRQLADRWAAAAGEHPREVEFRLRPAVGEPFRFQGFHFALIGAVIAVLLVACTNLANLQLARGITRAREMATRAAVGASRRDLMLQLLAEASWLALAGLALGLVLTAWGMKLVETSVPRSLSEFIVRPQASWRLFAFAAGAAGVSLLAVGLLPAIRISRVNINDVLKAGAGTGSSVASRRRYGLLVVVQVGLALALMVGGALMLRSAAFLYRIDVPPQFERMLFGYVRLNPMGQQPLEFMSQPAVDRRRSSPPADSRRITDVAADVLTRIRAQPSVENAAVAVFRAPVGLTIALADAGGKAREIVTGQYFSYRVVSSEYPRVVGMELHKGRLFAEGEFAEPLVIVDDRTARYLWPGQDPIGKRIKFGRDTSRAPWLEVIGVVRHFNFWSPFDRPNQEERAAPRMGAVLVLNGTDSTRVARGAMLDIVVSARREADVQRLPVQLRTAIQDPAAGVGLMYAQSWLRMTRLDMLRERNGFVAALFVTFAMLALAVAALGVYAVVSHSVSQRTREFGVRIALGASTGDIRRSVLREGNILALTGIALGLVVAARTVGWLQAFLRSDDERFNAPLFAVVALILFAIALLASWVPARRAMRINPVEALRNE